MRNFHFDQNEPREPFSQIKKIPFKRFKRPLRAYFLKSTYFPLLATTRTPLPNQAKATPQIPFAARLIRNLASMRAKLRISLAARRIRLDSPQSTL